MKITLTSNLVGQSCCLHGKPNGNWSLILNDYPPQTSAYYQLALTQLVLSYVTSPGAAPYVYLVDEVFAASSANDYFATSSFYYGNFPMLSGNTITMGYVTNSSGYVTEFVVTLGTSSGSQQFTLNTANAYSAPVVAINPDLVGLEGGEAATFSSGSATVQFTSSGSIFWQNNLPSWITLMDGYVNETSNMIYLQPVQVSSQKITQTWEL